MSDAEIETEFADLFAEGLAAIRQDVSLIVDMAEAAAQRLHPKRWAEAKKPISRKPAPLSLIGSPEAEAAAKARNDHEREATRARRAEHEEHERLQRKKVREEKARAQRERNDHIVRLCEEGVPYTQIALRLGMSPTGVRSAAHAALGLSRVTGKAAERTARDDQMIELHRSGLSGTDVARSLGVSKSLVSTRLRVMRESGQL